MEPKEELLAFYAYCKKLDEATNRMHRDGMYMICSAELKENLDKELEEWKKKKQ